MKYSSHDGRVATPDAHASKASRNPSLPAATGARPCDIFMGSIQARLAGGAMRFPFQRRFAKHPPAGKVSHGPHGHSRDP